MARTGVTVAGNIIVDQMFSIRKYPAIGELSQIDALLGRSTGGALCNVILGFARMDPSMPLQAIGKIGNDENGRFVSDVFRAYPNIDISGITYEDATGYTLVMNDQASKERTFFSYMGANGFLDELDFDVDRIHSKIFHIGYISLLKGLDRADRAEGTVLTRLLRRLQVAGIKTSIDVVSDSRQSYRPLVRSALRRTDYCIINELEAQGVTGVELRDSAGRLRMDAFPDALRGLRSYGVRDWIVIHAPEIGFGLDENDQVVRVDVPMLTREQIVDTVGAGDAFCSGVLLAAYRERSLEEAIRIGISAARCSLQGKGAVEGIKPLDQMTSLPA